RRARVHLVIEAIRMRIASSDVVEAWPELERPFEGGFELCELAARHKRAEIIDARFDLPACIETREPLFPVDLHEREQSAGPHFPIGLWKIVLPLTVQNVKRFKSGVGAHVLNASRNLS